MFLFSRIERDEVMAHDRRREILDTVTAQPGLTMQALQARLGVAWGTMRHHVHLLERHGHVVSVRQGPRRLLYAAQSAAARARSDLALLHTATAHGIAATVRHAPGIQQVELARRVGVRGPAISKHLTRLAAAGLVTVERRGGSCRYRPTPRLHAVLELRDEASAPSPLECQPPMPRPPRPLARTGRPDATAEDAASAALWGLQTDAIGPSASGPPAVGSLL